MHTPVNKKCQEYAYVQIRRGKAHAHDGEIVVPAYVCRENCTLCLLRNLKLTVHVTKRTRDRIIQ